ncbi:hypothetical protein LIX60_02050 [Streptomyces sp. S07_1.15]|uniref:hypothetical protein n=1 Tax=Streptomyces sp. S07_1.15 TaxID=2873925 RepID=UPI001D15807A|nr:hypothetical protein [Streptomyces sp. S07_1.15]MCC3650297.1 hypothetical protein [Streptomyces sp. S07_1.15]
MAVTHPDTAGPDDRDGAPADAEGGTGGLALELLVHGVGGATPQEVLDDPRTVRVTGDNTAGIHRRADDAGAERRPGRHGGEPVPEAYCWGGLTSGNGARALWLLLLPFMVVNLAHWMRPSATGSRTLIRLYGLLIRLVALSLTVLLTAAACEVALDLVAWQCAGSTECARSRTWLGFLSPGHGGWWSQPGRRLALAALIPAALTGLLWWLSHHTWSAYESAPPPVHEPLREGDPGAAHQPALRLPGFWYGRRLVARLRAAHTAAGFLTVAAALSAAATRYDRKPGGGYWLDLFGWCLEVSLVLAGLFVVWVVSSRGRTESVPDDRLDRAVVRFLPGTALGLLVLAAVHAAWSRPGWRSGGLLPGDETFGVIALGQGALVLAAAWVGHRLHRTDPDSRSALHGVRGAAVAVFACALGGVMSGGVAQRVADWLDGPGTPGMNDGYISGPPTVLSWHAAVIPPLLAVLVVIAAYFAGQTWRVRREQIEAVRASHPGEPEDTARTRRIAGVTATARLTDCAPWFLGATAVVTLLLGGVAVAGAWSTGEVPGRAADGAPGVVEAIAETSQALGSWLMGLGFLLFLAGGRRAYRDAAVRRTIGILWDVGTFWPRAAHPFAPPCYAERAVPDLTWRMETWTRSTGGRIVLSGHSQGSVLAAAAVWQLSPHTRRRVALLTYGSPLERLYGRWFPAYFGPGPLHALHHEIDCWRNLWRETDPIGGPVNLPGPACADDPPGPDVDRGPLKDPLAYGRTPEHPLPAPILGHFEYQADPVFAEERAALLDRLPDVPRPRAAGAAPGG